MSGKEGETRAEAAARGQTVGDDRSISDFLRESPFLLLSLLLHLIVFAVLATVVALEPEPPDRQLAIELEELTVQPAVQPQSPEMPSLGPLRSVPGRGQPQPAEMPRPEPAKDHRPQLPKIHRRKRPPDSAPGPRDGCPCCLYPRGKWSFAAVTIDAIANGRTLVVLMIDRSRSVIYGDLPKISELMNYYFQEIDRNLPVALTGRVRWQVVSYGRQPRFKGKPSSNIEYVKEAVTSAKVDTSGEENVGAAVEAVLDRFSNGDHENILIAALTDEAGDDMRNTVLLERIINRMRRNNAHFYVFGYESVFCARKRRVHLNLDPDLMRGQDREAIRGFAGQQVHAWIHGGPESPCPELWWGENWRRWRHWGATLNDLSSGFGTYGLTRLVLASGGHYFQLDWDRKYDREKLYGKYRPDICSRFVYDRRMKEIELRAVLKTTWEKMGGFYLRTSLRSDEQVRDSLMKARSARRSCLDHANQIERLLSRSKPRGHNWTRWVAHAELTRAELLRLHFMLGQYEATLIRAQEKYGEDLGPRKKRIIIRRGRPPADYKNFQHTKDARDMALGQIQLVIDAHKATPWAAMAGRLKRGIYPWKTDLRDQPGPPTAGDPSPPVFKF
jgi:hypothetical protein